MVKHRSWILMNARLITLLFVCLISCSPGYCQPNPDSISLMGSWVTNTSIVPHRIEDPLMSSYHKYVFTESMFFHATNEIERGIGHDYSQQGNDVTLHNVRFHITRLGRNQIQLASQTGSSWVLVKKDYYDSLRSIMEGVPIHQPPTFTGNFYLHTYMFSNAREPNGFISDMTIIMQNRLRTNAREDSYLKLNFHIDSMGMIRFNRPIVSNYLHKRQREKVRQKLEKTSGMWIPGEDTQDLQLTFTIPGAVSLRMQKKARLLFERSLRLYAKADYQSALAYISMAIDLNKENVDLYLLRSECFLRLDRVSEYCEDLTKAKNLNPLVKLDNIEYLSGRFVKIGCLLE